MSYLSSIYGVSNYELSDTGSDSVSEESSSTTKAPSFPFRFKSDSDIELDDTEAALKSDIVLAVFISKFGIPLYPIGAGINEYVFESDSPADLAFLSFEIEDAVRTLVPQARILPGSIQVNNSGISSNKISVAIPYSNLKTGKDSISLLAVNTQRTDV